MLSQRVDSSLSSAYLLIFRSRRDDIVHHGGHQLCYSLHSSSRCPVLGGNANCLPLRFHRIQPFAGYGVYDVEDA